MTIRQIFLPGAVMLVAALLWLSPTAHADEEACGNHGTSVTFVESPTEAAIRAKKEEKLVFILHVSGNFETPEYT